MTHGIAVLKEQAGSWSARLNAIIASVADPSTRVIGWGTGSVFNYFHHRHPLPLAYLIDNEPAMWGDCRAGIPVFGPDRLQEENPERTLIVVYSGAWPSIVQQLAEMGFHKAISASSLFALLEDEALRNRLRLADALCDAPVAREPRGSHAIVIQGPVVPDMTEYVLRVMSARHPNTPMILSTWNDAPAEFIAKAARLVDDIVISPAPESPGIQNRNCQIISTRAGLERAREFGATTVLKSRTDLVVLAADVFGAAEALRTEYPDNAARAAGAYGRLIVPSVYTRKFLLYHPSDLVMLGDLRDLETFWSAPIDPRSGTLEADGRATMPLADLGMSGNPAESYFGLHYCERLGRPVLGTVRDSWAFYRDFFAVVDPSWFDMVWLKNLATADVHAQAGPRALVNHAFWRSLASEHDGYGPEPEINPKMITLRDLGHAYAVTAAARAHLTPKRQTTSL